MMLRRSLHVPLSLALQRAAPAACQQQLVPQGVRSFAKAAGKKKKQWVIKKRKGPFYHPHEAVRMVKCLATAKFDETVEAAIQLGVDPRKPGQMIRGVANLPHGSGTTVRVAVFAQGPKAEEAKRAGATVVGAEDLVEQISSGFLDFDKTVATPDMMRHVARVARILGPRGLMPNPKLGTVTNDIEGVVEGLNQGQVDFRTEKKGIVQAVIGKASFTEEQLLDNLRALMVALTGLKPENLKGSYLRHVVLSSTMGPGITVDLPYIDPSSGKFMMGLDQIGVTLPE